MERGGMTWITIALLAVAGVFISIAGWQIRRARHQIEQTKENIKELRRLRGEQ